MSKFGQQRGPAGGFRKDEDEEDDLYEGYNTNAAANLSTMGGGKGGFGDISSVRVAAPLH